MKAINKYIFIGYIVISLTPILLNSYLQIGLMTLWIITAFGIQNRFPLDWKISIILWILYAIALRVVNFSTAAWGNYGNYLLLYFPLFAFCFYLNNYDQKDIDQIAFIITGVVVVNMLQNIYMLHLNPGATIELNFSDIYTGLNIGNSNYTFVVMLVLLICCWKALQGSKINLIITIIGVIYLVMSSKTTAFLVYVIFAFLMIVEKISRRIKRTQKIMIMSLVIILVPLLLYGALPIIQNWIKNDYINTRINALLSGNAESVYLSRIRLAQISWDTFVHHPIMGIGYVKADFSKVLYYTTGIGHHSEFIDHLGRYGIIGIIFYICIFRGYLTFLRGIVKTKENWRCAVYVFASFIVFSFLNNSMDSISGIIIFFLIPSICSANTDNKEYELGTNKTFERVRV